MLNNMPDEKRRQQNRESQRRYRKRHRMEPKDQVLEIAESSQSKLPMQQIWTSPDPSTSMVWAKSPHDRGNVINSLFPQTHIQVPAITHESLEQSHSESRKCCEYSKLAADSRNQTSTPTHPYMFTASLPPTEPFSMGFRTSENDNTNTNSEPSLRPTSKDLDSQPYNSILNVTIPREEPIGGVRASFPSSESNNSQDAWIRRPSSSHQMSFFDDKISHEKHHRHERISSGSKPSDQYGMRPLSESAAPRVSSRAVEMITDVENLYKFGVGIGILPEDRDTQILLKRMKIRFMSLLSAVSADDLDSSKNQGDEGDSDNSGSYTSSDNS